MSSLIAPRACTPRQALARLLAQMLVDDAILNPGEPGHAMMSTQQPENRRHASRTLRPVQHRPAEANLDR